MWVNHRKQSYILVKLKEEHYSCVNITIQGEERKASLKKKKRKASFRIHEYDTIYTSLKIFKAISYRILSRDTYTISKGQRTTWGY